MVTMNNKDTKERRSRLRPLTVAQEGDHTTVLQKSSFVRESRPQRCTPSPHPVVWRNGATMDRILQEISAVGRKLEGMDNTMASLTVETKSMRLDIAGLQSQVTGLDQRVTTVEAHIASWVDRDQ
ncbi:hypothetical protein NDU88_001307 [Pleurodeles waltl]|uniref:Uncharacterized protein n=1 Tax=Pleurodeles waltl TaxID=8319 RepID=A0AAV7Q5J2_PLEWA|nr:hypothetical protein NDU88_001307 [Pleurodeles waltl]